MPQTTPVAVEAKLFRAGEFVKVYSVIDTGASFCSISWEDAVSLGFEPGKLVATKPVVTANGVIESPVILLDSVEVLGKKASGVEAIVHNLPEKSGIEALIGISFLKHFKLTMDFPSGNVSLE